MRTTLDLDDDVMAASRDLASRRRTTIGAVISEMVRKALQDGAPQSSDDDGFVGLPRRAVPEPIDVAFVNRLRDEMGV